jgi:hypothetical protein
MPRVTQKTSKQGFHLDATAPIVLYFAFECHAEAEGFSGVVHTRVQSTKFSKHVQWLDVDSIPVQGNRHTAIRPEGLVFMRPLYEQFSRDFVREYVVRGSDDIWIELEYQRQEFQRTLIAIDVARQASFAYQRLVVGASVTKLPGSQIRQSPLHDPQTGLLTVVHINHGPYAC